MIDQESDMMNKQRTELFVTLSLKLYDCNCLLWESTKPREGFKHHSAPRLTNSL